MELLWFEIVEMVWESNLLRYGSITVDIINKCPYLGKGLPK